MVPSTPRYEDRCDFIVAIRLVGICHAGSLALETPQCFSGGSECMVGYPYNANARQNEHGATFSASAAKSGEALVLCYSLQTRGGGSSRPQLAMHVMGV